MAAWLRACIYFCACYLIAIGTGVFDALLSNPIATPEQINDQAWWFWVGGLIMISYHSLLGYLGTLHIAL